MTALDIEIAVAKFFGYASNIIVPNVYLNKCECDMVIISPSGYVTEVEIKVSKSNLKKDSDKNYNAHNSYKVKRFFYAVPLELMNCEYTPSDAGLIVVNNRFAKIVRPAKVNKSSKKLNQDQVFDIARLGCMRIWRLKENLYDFKRRQKT
jgi:hypothetical protein